MTAEPVDDCEVQLDQDIDAESSASTTGRNPLVDAYIARAAPFAGPILAHLRDVVHAACPDVTEAIKWRMPFFVRGGNLCHMAAFKAHCVFGFWRGKELADLLPPTLGEGMGHLGRILSLDDLPSRRLLIACIEAAARLDEAAPPPARIAKARTAPEMPGDLARALNAHPVAARAFNAFGAGAQREYVAWIVEAKRDATRLSRIATAIEWIAAGRTRNWKYAKR